MKAERILNTVSKKDIEELLCKEITDRQFKEALDFAKHKQACIYRQGQREEVEGSRYLAELTKDCVISLALQDFTMDLCRTIYDMEKEHSVNDQSAPTDNHIVSVPAL